MKVLTKNIKLFFECTTDDKRCPSPQKVETDPAEIAISGAPLCPICNDMMEMSDECLVTN